MNNLPLGSPLVMTSGEPAGIGPDLCLQWAANAIAAPTIDRPVVILGDQSLFNARAAQLGLPFDLPAYQAGADLPRVSFLHEPCPVPVTAGQLDPRNASYVLRLLDIATEGCLTGQFAGMVTAPVHKGVINEAGIAFTGHTEYLADKTATEQVVMMLAGGGLRVALATTHLPLSAVSAALTTTLLERVIRILHHDLTYFFGVASPRILVSGLNPHAGESGHMGREEIDVISPVLDRLRAEGMLLEGPLPADTLFQPKYLETADAVLAMYHDQGLPVLKFASFGQGVNITLGLPIVRTSVDHGTALSLAGTGLAEVGSLVAALATANLMADCRLASSSRH